MQRLSSHSSFLNKYLMPMLLLSAGALWIHLGPWDNTKCIPLGMLALAFAWLVWWGRLIRFVSTDGDQFLISDLRRRVLVPVSQLHHWTEDRTNRTPSICLYFDPPTEFGRKIRLITPTDFLSRKRFDAVVRRLEEITGRTGAISR